MAGVVRTYPYAPKMVGGFVMAVNARLIDSGQGNIYADDYYEYIELKSK